MGADPVDFKTCPDSFCASLQQAGLSPRTYRLILAKVASSHYTKNFVGIADYTLPSNAPRFFLIDLKRSSFKTFPVSHGIGSGGQHTVLFSNYSGRRESALGFMLTSPHTGKFGESLLLTGLSPSNTRLTPEAAILIHCAEYSSPAFFKLHGFWGRSFGCFTFQCESIHEVVSDLGVGALVLSYHDQLWDQAQRNPAYQEVTSPEDIPRGTDWEIEENLNGKAGGPYLSRYQR